MPKNDSFKSEHPGKRFRRFSVSFFIVFIIFIILVDIWQTDSAIKSCKNKIPASPDENLTALQKTKQLSDCLSRQNGIIDKILRRQTRKILDSLPNTPCNYVGEWMSTRPNSTYRISLQNNGEFIAEPVEDKGNARTIYGSWGVYKNKMVWFYNENLVWPPDANEIITENENTFSLVEHNGSKTKFTRIGPFESNACPPP
jgi:hypothetical protein